MSGGAQRLYACPVLYADLETCGSGLPFGTDTFARQYGISRWARKTQLTRLLYLAHLPRIDSFDDWAWILCI